MYISKILIKNFRLFSSKKLFQVTGLNIPDNTNEGSGLNVFVGENGSGKTSLLEAFTLPILEYKSDNFSIEDFNNPNNKAQIEIYSENEFEVAGTMPKGTFRSIGFLFEAGTRSNENKTYLATSVVTDQKFIKADPSKPKDGSPDLRVNVNNPFKGKRFSENDILFLDKNRLFQTKSGNFNTTRFDRLMEDFNFQYLKNSKIKNLNKAISDKVKKNKVENNFLAEAVKKFFDISGSSLKLDFLDNFKPFKNAFFAETKKNSQQILLGNLGSGYEMIFALLYSFYLAKQSGKQLIILIDEPELHLHPRLQEKFVNFLLEFSKNAQVIIASHSPLLVKQLSENSFVKVRVLENNGKKVSEVKKRVLPYISANETNFLAFNLATEEYHNELYNELEMNFWDDINNDFKTLKKNGNYDNNDSRQVIFDNEFFSKLKKEKIDSPFRSIQNKVTIHTYVRNKIHHSKENGGNPMEQDLRQSINKMRTFF